MNLIPFALFFLLFTPEKNIELWQMLTIDY